MNKRAVTILAAGKGTRMRSDLPKVLHFLNNKPLIAHVIETAQKLNPEKIITIVGYRHEEVRAALAPYPLFYALQEPQLGTAHALMQTKHLLENFTGDLLVLSGDVPLITQETLNAFCEVHEQTNAAATLLTAIPENSTGYGRIIRDIDGNIAKIIEEKDASPEMKTIKEINGGIYLFKSPQIFSTLAQIKPNNIQGEYYLTDVVELLIASGARVATYLLENPQELMNVNTPEQLAEVQSRMNARMQQSPTPAPF